MKIAGVNEIGSMEEQHVKVSVGGGNVQRKGETQLPWGAVPPVRRMTLGKKIYFPQNRFQQSVLGEGSARETMKR